MLKFGNKEFRNLQEQVKKNMDDILFILQEEGVLNEFGIKVVGQEDSVANMPTVADYKENNPDWSYGDAYAIGEEDPYELYILTRANGTHPDDYWFNIGEFPQPGPQGPAGADGEQGPQGEQGNPGVNGTSAGFGVISTTVTTLTPGSDATVSVVASGPDSSKNFAFSFGIPRGADGQDAPTPSIDWGEINGDIADQTDLVTALQGKQNTLVSGTNIKTINNQSLLGSGDITIDGKNNVLDLGSASSVTDEQLALLDADESLLIYATYGAYGKQLYVFRGEYTTGNLTYVSVPNKGSDNVEFLTLVINKSTKAITKSASNVYAGVSKIEVNGATYTPTMGKVVLPNYPTPGGSIDIGATATASSVSPTVPASASVTVDTSGDTPILEFSFDIPQGEKGETGATGPAGQDGLTTQIEVNGQTYTQSGGVITLPDYPTVPSLATVATTGDYDDLTNKPTIPTISASTATVSGASDLGSLVVNGSTYNIPQGGSGSVDRLIFGNTVYDPDANGDVWLPAWPTPNQILTLGTESSGTLTAYTLSQIEDKPHNFVIKKQITNFTYNYFRLQFMNASIFRFTQIRASIYETGPLTIDINRETGAWTYDATQIYTPVTQIEVNGATYTPSAGVVNLGTITASADWSDITNKPTFATVATSGSYDDLTNKPTIPVVPTVVSAFENDVGYITGIDSSDVTSALGYTPYSDANPDGFISGITSSDVTTALGYTPGTSDFSGSYNDLTDKPNFATVATSGSYNDLTDKPTIPVVDYPVTDVQVDGSSVLDGTVAKITMPTIPTVNNASLDIQVNGATVGTFSANASVGVTANITVPTNVSDLNNDSGFITGINSSDVTTALGYTPLATVTSGDVTGALGYTPYSSTNPSGYISGITSGDVTTALGYTPGTSNFSGDYTDLTNKPTIPTISASTTTVSGASDLGSIEVNGSTYNVPQGGSSIGFDIIYIDSSTSTTSGTLSAEDLAKIVDHPTRCIIRKWGSSAAYTQYYELTEIEYTNNTQTTPKKYLYELVQAATTSSVRGRALEITASTGVWKFTTKSNPIPTICKIGLYGTNFNITSNAVWGKTQLAPTVGSIAHCLTYLGGSSGSNSSGSTAIANCQEATGKITINNVEYQVVGVASYSNTKLFVVYLNGYTTAYETIPVADISGYTYKQLTSIV